MLQLLHMMDDWTLCLEKGGQIDAIYSYFEKAFDKVPHKRLISKLRLYMIDEAVIKWNIDFLPSFQAISSLELTAVIQVGKMLLVGFLKAVFWANTILNLHK